MTIQDFREYERQALALAEGASLDARSAIEQLVKSIRPSLEPAPPRAPVRKMSMTAIVLLASTAVYSLYLPLALWIHRSYVPTKRPPGKLVEMLQRTDPYGGFMYRSRSFTMQDYADHDEAHQHSPIILYEDMKPLGPGHSDLRSINEKGLGRYAHVNESVHSERDLDEYLFSTSDNSDPRTNGRSYWAVLPE